jgi:hypothetical protein
MKSHDPLTDQASQQESETSCYTTDNGRLHRAFPRMDTGDATFDKSKDEQSEQRNSDRC